MMHVRFVPGQLRLLASVIVLPMLLLLALPAAAFAQSHADSPGFYQQTNLVSDLAGAAQFTDPQLVNPWGLVHGPTTPWWVADNGTGLDRKSTRLNSSHANISYAVFCLKKKTAP